jgi:hypothetical protein
MAVIGEQEREVPPGQALVVAGRPADPVAGQPELGHHIERDQVADELVGLLGELGG